MLADNPEVLSRLLTLSFTPLFDKLLPATHECKTAAPVDICENKRDSPRV